MYRLLMRHVSRAHPGAARALAGAAVRTVFCAARLVAAATNPPLLPVTVMGLDFPNPVGLAAGFDRNGAMVPSLGFAGFGFVEIGTVMPDPSGNGSNGIAVAVSNLNRARARRPHDSSLVLGVNIGSARTVYSELVVQDCVSALQALWSYADYVAVNLSSPHGWNGANGADRPEARMLLEKIKDQHASLAARTGRRPPLAVKVAVTDGSLPLAARAVGELGFDALIAVTDQTDSPDRACGRIRELAANLSPAVLISVGGVRSADTARRRLEAGAALLQLYTGLVEDGPLVARRIVVGLRDRYSRLRKDAH